MAIPKTLRRIDAAKAERLIALHLAKGDGEWEGGVGVSDFVYGGLRNMTLIRPPCWGGGDWETGRVSL